MLPASCSLSVPRRARAAAQPRSTSLAGLAYFLLRLCRLWLSACPAPLPGAEALWPQPRAGVVVHGQHRCLNQHYLSATDSLAKCPQPQGWGRCWQLCLWTPRRLLAGAVRFFVLSLAACDAATAFWRLPKTRRAIGRPFRRSDPPPAQTGSPPFRRLETPPLAIPDTCESAGRGRSDHSEQWLALHGDHGCER